MGTEPEGAVPLALGVPERRGTIKAVVIISVYLWEAFGSALVILICAIWIIAFISRR